MRQNTERSMAELEREIARTRAELSMTLDAVRAELAPERLVEKGADMITDFVRTNWPDGIRLGGGVRADPIAIGLIGFGLAWFIAENAGLLSGMTGYKSDRETHIATAPRISYHTAEGHRSEIGDGHQPPAGNGWVRQAADAAQGAWKSISRTGGTAIERAGGYLGGIGDSAAGRWAGSAGGKVAETVGNSSQVLLGALGVAVGAALALLLPATRREREWITQTRDDIWERAEAIGHRAADCVRNAADAEE